MACKVSKEGPIDGAAAVAFALAFVAFSAFAAVSVEGSPSAVLRGQSLAQCGGSVTFPQHAHSSLGRICFFLSLSDFLGPPVLPFSLALPLAPGPEWSYRHDAPLVHLPSAKKRHGSRTASADGLAVSDSLVSFSNTAHSIAFLLTVSYNFLASAGARSS
eukprot:6398551-Lingulodinium_polyedra.AAC.1